MPTRPDHLNPSGTSFKSREDADHRLAQRVEGGVRILLAEGAAAAEDDAVVDHAEPAHHALGLGIGSPRRHQAAREIMRQPVGGDDGAAERHQRVLHMPRRVGQVGIAVGGDDDLPRAHRAFRRLDDDAPVLAPQPQRRAFLIDRDAARREAFGEAMQIVQRMDAAGARIEHAADERLRAGFLAHFMGVEDADIARRPSRASSIRLRRSRLCSVAWLCAALTCPVRVSRAAVMPNSEPVPRRSRSIHARSRTCVWPSRGHGPRRCRGTTAGISR